VAVGEVGLVSWVRADIDTERPNPARIYNFLLGGVHNLPVDREVARRALAVHPRLREEVRANRAFLGRVVKTMVTRGIRQFLDIGCGIPAPGGLLDTVGAARGALRVVNVDIDAVAVAHTLAAFGAEPAVGVLQADLVDPEEILSAEPVRRLIDLTEPVGVLLLAVLHFVPDARDPYSAVGQLRDALAPGSLVAVSHLAPGIAFPPAGLLVPREPAAIRQFLDGLDLLGPGLVPTPGWHAEPVVPQQPGPDPRAREQLGYAAVGRKPMR